jgi:HNH endonuclease
MLGCTAALSWMRHARDGKILDLDRRRRRPGKALRKAARERDRGRCRYPGCESRQTDLHHIQYWTNGGRTCLENLINLCRRHHTAVHDRGYLIAARENGTFTFYRPDGAPLPPSPALPAPDGTIADVHDADITPDTIIPPWYGERLDLDYAIYTCLANERVYQDRAAGRAPRAGIEPCDCRPGAPADPIAYFREYYAKHPEERRRPAA